MKIGGFDIGERILVIAEIGNNHEGSRARAEELIHAAADSGADAVKFQTIVAEELVSTANPDRMLQLRRFQLPVDDFYRLADLAEKRGVMFLSTPFHLAAVDQLDPIVPAFKIASGDNDFLLLLEKAARTGKPILLSTGLASLADVAQSVSVIEHAAGSKKGQAKLVLLHCVTCYPTPREQAGLGAIEDLKRLGYPVGYSDHVLGLDAALIAVSLGARIVEKHFTLDKAQSAFRDHQLSADPPELAKLCDAIRRWEAAENQPLASDISDRAILIGEPIKQIMPCEREMVSLARRSIAAVRPFSGGERFGRDDIIWVRPQIGFRPGEEDRVIGRRAAGDIAGGQTITPDLLR